MLKSTLLFLSRRKSLRNVMENSQVFSGLTKRFVAGKTLEQALRVAQRLNAEGILVSLDCLGEDVTSLEEAEHSCRSYLEALEGLAGRGIDATVSIKLTQFGLGLSEDLCQTNVTRLVEAAGRRGQAVEVDMESSEYTERTLRLVEGLHERHGRVRAVVQAYLYRTAEDVERLCAKNVPVRLCKGAYRESAAVAYQGRGEVNASYRRLMRALLVRGNYPGIATHDEAMIREALRFAAENRIPPSRFEFQMLYGIRRDLQRYLVAQGYRLRLYVPYGVAWYPYFMRRLAERPSNLLFLARNLLRR